MKISKSECNSLFIIWRQASFRTRISRIANDRSMKGRAFVEVFMSSDRAKFFCNASMNVSWLQNAGTPSMMSVRMGYKESYKDSGFDRMPTDSEVFAFRYSFSDILHTARNSSYASRCKILMTSQYLRRR